MNDYRPKPEQPDKRSAPGLVPEPTPTVDPTAPFLGSQPPKSSGAGSHAPSVTHPGVPRPTQGKE